MTAPTDLTAPGTQRRLLAAAVLASFVSFLDGSITNIALPAIERDLGGGVVTQQWVVDGYLLTLSAFILLAGAVSDRFGRLRVLRIALVSFAATSLLCAVAPTAGILIGARVLQGVAGALLVPGSLALIIAVFEGEAQARAIGTWTGWTSVSSLFGPVVGGLLVDGLGWRTVFVIGLLPAAAAMLLLGRAADGPRPAPARFDLPSAVLAAVGLGALTVGLIELGGGRDAVLPRAASAPLAVAGAVLLVLFVLRDRRAPDALVPPALFASRNFAAGNGTTLLVYGALGLASLVPTLYLQQVLGLTATVAALAGLPPTVLMILLSSRFGALAGRFGPRAFMAAGPAVAAVGALVWLLTAVPGVPRVAVLVTGSLILGLGLAVTVAPLTAAVLGAVPPAQSGIGSAVNNAVARVAGLITTASAGVVLGGAIDTAGLGRVALLVALLLLGGAVISFAGIRNGAVRHPA